MLVRCSVLRETVWSAGGGVDTHILGTGLYAMRINMRGDQSSSLMTMYDESPTETYTYTRRVYFIHETAYPSVWPRPLSPITIATPPDLGRTTILVLIPTSIEPGAHLPLHVMSRRHPVNNLSGPACEDKRFVRAGCGVRGLSLGWGAEAGEEFVTVNRITWRAFSGGAA